MVKLTCNKYIIIALVRIINQIMVSFRILSQILVSVYYLSPVLISVSVLWYCATVLSGLYSYLTSSSITFIQNPWIQWIHLNFWLVGRYSEQPSFSSVDDSRHGSLILELSSLLFLGIVPDLLGLFRPKKSFWNSSSSE